MSSGASTLATRKSHHQLESPQIDWTEVDGQCEDVFESEHFEFAMLEIQVLMDRIAMLSGSQRSESAANEYHWDLIDCFSRGSMDESIIALKALMRRVSARAAPLK